MLVFFRWQSVVDYLVPGTALYVVLRWATEARAVRVALAIVALLAGDLVARAHHLAVTSLVLEAAAVLIVASLLVVFQPEVRRAFTRLDTALLLGSRRTRPPDWAAAAIGEAAFALAEHRIGALIVLVRNDPLAELDDGGVPLHADLSRPLLESIFQKDSPLHDGAAIIEGERVTRACALLPLTARGDLPQAFGTRHRAAVGLAERSDALVVVVSEQRGRVTLVDGREMRSVESPTHLARLLLTPGGRRPAGVRDAIRRWVAGNWGTKLAAAGLGGLIWVLAISTASTVFRTVTVPVVLQVPPALDVAEQWPTTLTVQLRGPEWILDTNAANGVVAHVDVARAGEGWTTVRVTDSDLSLPPGVEMERASPATIRVRLVRQATVAGQR